MTDFPEFEKTSILKDVPVTTTGSAIVEIPNYLTEELSAKIQDNFTYHSPTPSQQQRYQTIRYLAKDLANTFGSVCPPSSERDEALKLLGLAVMMANASIARNEK